MYNRVSQFETENSNLFNNLKTSKRFQQVKYEIDPEYLFSPSNGEGKSEREVVEQYFKVNYTHRFNVGRITRAGKIIKIVTERE